jgi:CheY-like chemotaxis protein
LIVDDDDDLLESLSSVLGEHYEVLEARNGDEAWQALQRQSFHGMVLDLTMPVMDGETLIEKLRTAGIALPVVLASGIADLHQRAARLGVEHISKPYDLAVLIDKLQRILANADEH